MSSAPFSRVGGKGLSLERKLPLLITALLVVTMAGGMAFAYREVKRSAVETVSERLQPITRQLSDLLAPTVPQRIDTLRAVARDPALVAYLSDPSDASRPAALRALARLRTPSQPEQSMLLWDRDRQTLLRIANSPAAPSVYPREAVALADSFAVSRFLTLGRRAWFWVTAPVHRDGAVVGYVAELRLVGGASTARQLETLIGRDISVYFTNSGDGPWVALDGTLVPAPRTWPFTGAARYLDTRGAEHIAHATALRGTPWSIVAEEPMRAVLARPRMFLRRSAMAALLLSLIGMLGAWVLSRHVTSPVTKLRLAAEAIARGDYTRRIDLERSDELGILADSFNRMAAQVEVTHQELTQANRAKSEFLATMSHEIRTPINAIIGYTDLMQLGISGPVNDMQLAQLERIRVSGRHLIGLVNQILDLSRIESGTLSVEQQVSSTLEAVETALTVLRPQAESKGVELVARCEGAGGPSYLGDPQRVGQILVNLLSNAIKFTEPGGRTTIECETYEGRLPEGGDGVWTRVRVEDTGVGIPPEQITRIFEPFVQVESGYTRQHGGTGLGLAISLRLARAMGGTLSVESEPGAGSRFTLWLPAAAVAEGAREYESARVRE